jgi:hypothetical protein
MFAVLLDVQKIQILIFSSLFHFLFFQIFWIYLNFLTFWIFFFENFVEHIADMRQKKFDNSVAYVDMHNRNKI